MKIVDGTFDYTDERFPMGSDCACRLRVWQAGGRSLVMATELNPSPGASVTNTAERWAEEAVKEYDLDPAATTFVEHYERGADGSAPPAYRSETFDFVTFTWKDGRASRPQWRHGTKEAVESIIGERLA